MRGGANLHMTSPTGRIALTDSLPVEVLMKSDPAIMQTNEALYTLAILPNSPIAKIDFMWISGPHAAFMAFTSSYSSCQRCLERNYFKKQVLFSQVKLPI